MSALRRLVLRILNLVRHRDREAELSREIDAHLNQLQQDFERRGLSQDEARLAARRAFAGGVEQAKERQRDERSCIWLEDLRRDIGYGVLAYTISQQTREIAIRMALGGECGHVVRMVLRLGLQLVGVGLLIGVAASLATNRLLESQLWNISPHDPMTFATAISAIVAVAILACLVPARRAVRVEPMVALRHE